MVANNPSREMRVRYFRSPSHPASINTNAQQAIHSHVHQKVANRSQQGDESAVLSLALASWYRMEQLLERSATLPQTYQTMAGNDGKSPKKLTVNSNRVRRTELVKKSTDKTRRRIQPNDWSSNTKAGLSNTQKLVPDVASKRCVPTYVNDVALTQQLVVNPSSGFLSANQKRRHTTYVIQTLALAQNSQTQATVELTIVDICSQLDIQTTHMRTNLSQLVPDATLETASHQLIKTLPFCPQ
ncbi:microtubule-associated protein 70-2-like [Dorcoceras hygrometricum]|uniref:Microtubule-associated protein 70-2-like n=1 Tax=Dorcoceras hygrometricum TaxID=472368 RepID=A0A2Z7AQN4_9LAMI|nr:microtubule-associated protein 70-2-like [Dorcoceras hygrometricum]